MLKAGSGFPTFEEQITLLASEGFTKLQIRTSAILKRLQHRYSTQPMFWKKKTPDKTHDSKIILGMIILNSDCSFDICSFTDDFKRYYGHNIQEPTGDNTSFIFHTDGQTIAIAHMAMPIPLGDIEGTAKYAYNWQTALEDTKDHRSHLIVSLMQGGPDQVNRFKIFTQVLCSLLRTTNAIGVYIGNQSLLISKFEYLSEGKLMGNNYLPLNLWIYFGLYVNEKGNGGYTYGLKQFYKTEMEIENSSQSLDNIRSFLFNIAHYVLEYDVTFEDGQTVGVSEDEKIPIKYSPGQFVEGNTYKFTY